MSTPSRPRSARGQGSRLRIDLLGAAAELLEETGAVEAVSLRAVATRAGVSPTAVYGHFSSADDLIESMVLRGWDAFDDALRAVIPDGASPFEEFRAMGDGYVRYAADYPGTYGVLMAQPLPDNDRVMARGLAVFDRLVAVLRQILVENGDDRDPVFVAGQVHSWMHGIVVLCTNLGKERLFTAEELIASIPETLRLEPRPC